MKRFVPGSTPGKQHRSVQAKPRMRATDLSASFPIDAVPAVVIASPELLKKSPEDWVLAAAHQMFHVFQATNGSYGKTATLKISSSDHPSWQLTFLSPTKCRRDAVDPLAGYTLWLTPTNKDEGEAQYNLGTALERRRCIERFSIDWLGQPIIHIRSFRNGMKG